MRRAYSCEEQRVEHGPVPSMMHGLCSVHPVRLAKEMDLRMPVCDFVRQHQASTFARRLLTIAVPIDHVTHQSDDV